MKSLPGYNGVTALELKMTLHKQDSGLSERCPIRDVLDRLGDRWTLLVLMELRDRHDALQRAEKAD